MERQTSEGAPETRETAKRRVPRCPPAPAGPPPRPEWRRESYTVRVVTPLFGGGPTPGENDPVTTVRGASVRGHLRFWWRATRGASCGDARTLFRREGGIWGTTEEPSCVAVTVRVLDEGSAVSPKSRRLCSYVLFPFMEMGRRADGGEPSRGGGRTPTLGGVRNGASDGVRNGRAGVVFELTLAFPQELKAEVLTALWAWVNFGGIGARTRRGCGALFCEALAPRAAAAPQAIRSWYASCQDQQGWEPPAAALDWPTMPPPDWLLVGASSGRDPEAAWAEVVRVLREFRQGRPPGRSAGRDGPERQTEQRRRWPEGRALRFLRATRGYGGEAEAPSPRDFGFPRAELGLPIRLRAGGNEKSLLPSGGSKRMASPVILRPVVLASGEVLPMALRLRTKPLQTVSLESGPPFGAEFIRNRVFAEQAGAPLHDLSNQGSALEAFMAYARQEFDKGGRVR